MLRSSCEPWLCVCWQSAVHHAGGAGAAGVEDPEDAAYAHQLSLTSPGPPVQKRQGQARQVGTHHRLWGVS